MARKFVTERELKFINDINKQLVQNVSGQEVIYYAVDDIATNSHRLYKEAPQKVIHPPVRVNARVEFDNPQVESARGHLDSRYNLGVYFHNKELEERKLIPKEGDFIEYGQVYYEITSVTQPQLVFGQVNNKIMTKCTCVPSRENQFQNFSSSEQDIDNSNPISQSMHIRK